MDSQLSRISVSPPPKRPVYKYCWIFLILDYSSEVFQVGNHWFKGTNIQKKNSPNFWVFSPPIKYLDIFESSSAVTL